MPRTRALETYPNRQFRALALRVLDTGQPFIVGCSRPQAASMRGELYAWRRACEANPVDAEMLQIPVARLRELAFRVTDKGLEAIMADTLQTPSLIDAALGGTEPILSAADEALARLRGSLLRPTEPGHGAE